MLGLPLPLARGAFSQSHPEVLSGVSMDSLPWLKSRSEHLRLSQLRDTSAPRREQIAEAQRFAQLQIGSVLLLAFHVQGKPAGLLGLVVEAELREKDDGKQNPPCG